MATIENKVFKNLFNEAEIENLLGGDYLIAHDTEKEFYFYFSISKNAITEQGNIELTDSQYEILETYIKKLHREEAPENAFENITDHYDETGTNELLFI